MLSDDPLQRRIDSLDGTPASAQEVVKQWLKTDDKTSNLAKSIADLVLRAWQSGRASVEKNGIMKCGVIDCGLGCDVCEKVLEERNT